MLRSPTTMRNSFESWTLKILFFSLITRDRYLFVLLEIIWKQKTQLNKTKKNESFLGKSTEKSDQNSARFLFSFLFNRELFPAVRYIFFSPKKNEKMKVFPSFILFAAILWVFSRFHFSERFFRFSFSVKSWPLDPFSEPKWFSESEEIQANNENGASNFLFDSSKISYDDFEYSDRTLFKGDPREFLGWNEQQLQKIIISFFIQ